MKCMAALDIGDTDNFPLESEMPEIICEYRLSGPAPGGAISQVIPPEITIPSLKY
jgi:hypothetical protein